MRQRSACWILLLTAFSRSLADDPTDQPVPSESTKHWAYRSPIRASVTEVEDRGWVNSPIDAFLAAGHQQHGLTPVAAAGKQVLLRRVYLDLVGLPPTRKQMQTFLADDSPDAYETVVSQLLASPLHGERWGRHWMDIWRYSDAYGVGETFPNSQRHIWRWRDWIAQSLNENKGYDRMILEMLAADEIVPDDPSNLRATGFLARSYYVHNRDFWLDAVVEHTAKAFVGVTINCCRCHEHKFDPISQEQYYSMRAIFEAYDVRTDRVPGESDVLKDGLPRIYDVHLDTPTFLYVRGDEKQPDKSKGIPPAVPAVFSEQLHVRPVELPIEAYYPALREEVLQEDLQNASDVIEVARAEWQHIQQELAAAGQRLGQSAVDGKAEAQVELYEVTLKAELAEKKVTAAVSQRKSLAARIAAEKAKFGLTDGTDIRRLTETASLAQRQAKLHVAARDVLGTRQKVAAAEKKLDDANPETKAALDAAKKELDSAGKRLDEAKMEGDAAVTIYEPLGEVYPKTSTGRRLALARWIVSHNNPLTARVAVNHIWLRHFGATLVDNVFDFGLRTTRPRHVGLLDWLSVELMDSGWNMKYIHRLIATSAAYRMASSDHAAAAANLTTDPDNLYLWRMNSRRLEAEAIRDSMLHAAGNLDMAMGGPELDQTKGQTTSRRSLYFRTTRFEQMRWMVVFDLADVTECYRRSESVVPQQALALANSSITLDQSRLLARVLVDRLDTKAENPIREFIVLAFERVLSRSPSPEELDVCRDFLSRQQRLLADPTELRGFTGKSTAQIAPSPDPAVRARENLVNILFNHNDFVTVR